jgi:hypothetical protein
MKITKKGQELETRLTRNYFLPFQTRLAGQALCSRIHRHAVVLQRLAETACNRELTTSEEGQDARFSQSVKDLVDQLRKLGYQNVVGVNLNGDPRGTVVKIKVNDHVGDSWGGDDMVCVDTARRR